VTRQPFDPDEVGSPDGPPDPELERAAHRLNRFRDLTADSPGPGFADRVMAAIDREPAPRAGLLGRLLATRAWQQPLRAIAVATVVVLAVGGALVAGEMAGILRQAPSGASGSPVVTTQQTATPSPEASEPAGETPEPSESPGTPEPTFSPTPSESPQSTEQATPRGSRSATPSPSSSDRETETPHPSATATSSDG
jgi:hypothetical protein